MRTMATSSEKIRHVMNAKLARLVLENCDRVSENAPDDDAFDIGGKSMNAKKLIIEAFQKCRPTAMAVNALAVGTDVEPYAETGSTLEERATMCHQRGASAITPATHAHSQSKSCRQMLGKLLLATKINLSVKT